MIFLLIFFLCVLHSVNENGLEDYVSPRFSSAVTEVNTSRMPERHKYVTGELLLFFCYFD